MEQRVPTHVLDSVAECVPVVELGEEVVGVSLIIEPGQAFRPLVLARAGVRHRQPVGQQRRTGEPSGQIRQPLDRHSRLVMDLLEQRRALLFGQDFIQARDVLPDVAHPLGRDLITEKSNHAVRIDAVGIDPIDRHPIGMN